MENLRGNESTSIVKCRGKNELELQLHEQFAINRNSILRSMLALFAAMLAVLGGYGYVFLHSSPLLYCKAEHSFTLEGLAYTAAASVLVMYAVAWLCIEAGYGLRKEQFIIDSIRKQHYTKEEYYKIYPQDYNPYGKKYLHAMQFPYDTLFVFSLITIGIIVLSFVMRALGTCPCSENSLYCLTVLVFLVLACIIIPLVAVFCGIGKKYSKYRELQDLYSKNYYFISSSVKD